MIASVTAVSVAMFLASVLVTPLILIWLPETYFLGERVPFWTRLKEASPYQAFLMLAKNLAGGVLFLAGVLMLVLPGQGLLTILIALILMDFPHKKRVERWLLSRKSLLRSVNWLRRRYKKPPLKL